MVVQQEEDRLVRKQEVLDRLAISEPTFYKLVKTGTLAAVWVGSCLKVRESVLRSAVQNGFQRPTKVVV